MFLALHSSRLIHALQLALFYSELFIFNFCLPCHEPECCFAAVLIKPVSDKERGAPISLLCGATEQIQFKLRLS